ncbi:MAG: hypothetical protein KA248_01965 [Kiritimatiellae bacterium]|nr:hypothetical protein [Kiritimatiellia bacterium]
MAGRNPSGPPRPDPDGEEEAEQNPESNRPQQEWVREQIDYYESRRRRLIRPRAVIPLEASSHFFWTLWLCLRALRDGTDIPLHKGSWWMFHAHTRSGGDEQGGFLSGQVNTHITIIGTATGFMTRPPEQQTIREYFSRKHPAKDWLLRQALLEQRLKETVEHPEPSGNFLREFQLAESCRRNSDWGGLLKAGYRALTAYELFVDPPPTDRLRAFFGLILLLWPMLKAVCHEQGQWTPAMQTYRALCYRLLLAEMGRVTEAMHRVGEYILGWEERREAGRKRRADKERAAADRRSLLAYLETLRQIEHEILSSKIAWCARATPEDDLALLAEGAEGLRTLCCRVGAVLKTSRKKNPAPEGQEHGARADWDNADPLARMPYDDMEEREALDSDEDDLEKVALFKKAQEHLRDHEGGWESALEAALDRSLPNYVVLVEYAYELVLSGPEQQRALNELAARYRRFMLRS